MALTTNPKVWKFMVGIFLMITLVLAIFYYFQDILITFIIGAVLIIVTDKLLSQYNESMQRRKYPRWKRKVYGYGHAVFWIFALYLLIVSQANDVVSLVADAQDKQVVYVLSSRVDRFVPEVFGQKVITTEHIIAAQNYFFSLLSSILSKISFIFVNAILIVPLMFHIYFRRRKQIINYCAEHVPKKFHDGFIRALKDISREFHDFFAAKVLESIIVGGIYCLGFYFAGVKGWFFFGVLSGFMNIVPYLGPILAAVPVLIISLIDSPFTAGFALVTILIAQAVDNFYIIPFLISSKVRMDSMLTIILILVGAKLFGILGMIFAIPIYIVYKVILKESYEELVKVYPEK